jgi:RNA polymerase sigma factor (sigma-70 family)
VGSFYSQIRHADLDDLITGAKSKTNNDSPEMGEIVRRFDGLAAAVAYGLTPDHSTREDLANAARFALVAAVRNHTTGQDGFPSYAKVYMVGAAKRELKHWTKSALPDDVQRLSLDDELDADVLFKIHLGQSPMATRTWDSAEMVTAVERMKHDQKKLLQQRFVEDMTLGSIASVTGTTESAVSQRLATAIQAVRRAVAA